MDNEAPKDLADYYSRGEIYLLVALPDWLKPVIPVNASSLVREWRFLLDPVRAIAVAAREFIADEDWRVENHFVVPDFEIIERLRLAAADDAVAEAIDQANETAQFIVGTTTVPLRSLVTHAVDHRIGLYDEAQPVLLGLAAAVIAHTVTTRPGLLLEGKVAAAAESRERERIKRQEALRTERRKAREEEYAERFGQLPPEEGHLPAEEGSDRDPT